MEENFPTVEVEFACITCSAKGIEGQERAAKCLEMSFKYFKVNLQHVKIKTRNRVQNKPNLNRECALPNT